MATDLSSTECRLLLDRLVAGQPPPIPLAHRFLVGFDDLLARWRNDMAGYVAEGGSLLRIVAAPAGQGKTHLARALQAIAGEMGFLNCHIDAQSQHTDDDLSLHGALCGSLLTPSAILDEQSEGGLLGVFRLVADRMSEADARTALQNVDIPVAFLRDLIPRVIGALRRWEDARILSVQAPDVAVSLRLIAGQQVDGTRSLRRLRLTYGGPVLRAMARTPGKRDAKLWIESLLRILPRLGFRGALVSIDEHDYANQRLLDRHIVQLRRLADGLATQLAGYLTIGRRTAEHQEENSDIVICTPESLDSTTQELGPTRDAVLETAVRRLDLSQKQAAEAYTLAEAHETNPRSVWGYVQGLTRLSQRTPWQDGRFVLDRAASRLFTTVH